jgi:chromosome segregation ATPase
LLRNSKNRIIRLETDSKAKDQALLDFKSAQETASALLTQNTLTQSNQIASLTNQLDTLTTLKRDLQFKDLRLTKQSADLDRLTLLHKQAQSEIITLREHLELKSTEFASLSVYADTQTEQVKVLMSRNKQLEETMQLNREDLEIGKRMFESKSTENDHTRLRISEYEARFYSLEEECRRMQNEVEVVSIDLSQSKAEYKKRGAELERVRGELEVCIGKLQESQVVVDSNESVVGKLREVIRLGEVNQNEMQDMIDDLSSKMNVIQVYLLLKERLYNRVRYPMTRMRWILSR